MSPVHHFSNSHRGSAGFVTIASVAALVVIAVVTATFVLLATYQSTVSELTWRDALQAGWLSDACGEHAIAQLRQSPDYPGGETLTFDQAECQVMSVAATLSEPFELKTQGQVGDSIARSIWTILISQIGSGSNDIHVASHQHVIEF